MEKQTKNKIHTVGIIGLGLLGTSLGMALRGKNVRRLGWTRQGEVRSWALQHDVIDHTEKDVRNVLSQADLVILCMPIPATVDFLHRHAGDFKAGGIVSDIGSIKKPILSAADGALAGRDVRFVGAHPMAGTEKSGHLAAFPALYDNADVFVCTGADEEAVRSVADFWEMIGTHVTLIQGDKHDALVARTSHVLHVIASALANSILESTEEFSEAQRFAGCATGFRDTSRIASSSPAMWREIVEGNHDAVLSALDEIQEECARMRALIADGDFDGFEKFFARGKALRDQWLIYKKYPSAAPSPAATQGKETP